jgi:hypothetical protein
VGVFGLCYEGNYGHDSKEKMDKGLH